MSYRILLGLDTPSFHNFLMVHNNDQRILFTVIKSGKVQPHQE